MKEDLSFSENDYPGLYQAADTESLRSQKIYFKSLSWFLCFLILGSIVSLFAGESKLYAITATVFFLGSLSLSLLIAVKRDDRTWYSARAVAESVKTRTWRYMMRAEPYGKTTSELEARNCFLSDLQEILKENREVTKELCNESASHDAISGLMGRVRALALSDRLAFYCKYRVEEQRNWYNRKAVKNRKDRAHWFIGIVTFNSLAIICALFRIAYSSWSYLPTQVFAVAAASGVSWLHARRFSELATSYALATHEITIIQSRVPSVSNEDDLSRFVSDTENAFSREHTQWVARRDAKFRPT